MKRLSNHSRRSGFSLLEIVIAVSVIVVLAGVVSLSARGISEKAKVAKQLELISTIKLACQTYQMDTSLWPIEYTGYAAANRGLSATQTTAGWKGPYLEQPFTAATLNPFAGTGHIYNTATAGNFVTGFDIDGDGTEEVTGACSLLWLSNIDAGPAQQIDQAIDGVMTGTWSNVGRVRYNTATKHVLVCMYN